ncbi:DinB family protein [Bacillus testis]|uniref:DinB family protein n=1 Tax=Bacillus testis TaxID=1622072 RepID=UPI00067E9713|nr:DinB family protein [Bacillus testis]
MEFKIQELAGYTPHIGHLVSMMDHTRETTLFAVRDLTMEELDYLHGKNSNSIGALLWHMAAVERYYQIYTFEEREPAEEELGDLLPGLELGESGRSKIKGHDLSYYLDRLYETRTITLERFTQLDDEWLHRQNMWGDHPSNPYFMWFHVFEDELNHRGQIRLLRKWQKEACQEQV